MGEVAAICLAAGLPAWPAVTAVAVGWAESGGNAYAIGINDQSIGGAHLSLDLGLWQTNTFWHPEIAIAEALDPAAQVVHVERIARRPSQSGWVTYGWSAWNTYKVGAHLRFLSAARVAVRAAGGDV